MVNTNRSNNTSEATNSNTSPGFNMKFKQKDNEENTIIVKIFLKKN